MPDQPLLDRIESAMNRLCDAGAWLALPVSMLLCAQWPLRDVPGGHPQLANDSAQALFALYVALAVRHTMRRNGHLRAEGLAGRLSASARMRLARASGIVSAAVLLPWSGTLLWLAAPQIGQSLAQWERFPDTLNPGYFVVKFSVGLLLALIGLQSLAAAMRRQPGR